MKQRTKLILFAVLFVALMAAALWVYRNLSDQYTQDTMEAQTAAPSTEKAADFSVLDSAGEIMSLSDFYGKPILINFWATWCGPCKEELPTFQSMYTQYGDEIVFMMVNLANGQTDTMDSTMLFLSDAGYDFPVYYDTTGEAAEAYNVRGIPVTVAIDAEGNIADTYLGAMSEQMLQTYIDTLLE